MNSKPTRRAERVQRARLGLRPRAGAAEGLAARVVRRALVVVAPLRREVAVEVDAVARGDLPVAVVVAQVLAPQALAVLEREVVAVGVGDREEPELVLVDQPPDRRIGVVAVDEVVHEPADHLGRDPLARVLRAEVQDRGLAAVALVARVAAHLERHDVLAVHRAPDAHELRDPPVRRRRPARTPPSGRPRRCRGGRPEARGRGGGRALGRGPAADLLRREHDAARRSCAACPPLRIVSTPRPSRVRPAASSCSSWRSMPRPTIASSRSEGTVPV